MRQDEVKRHQTGLDGFGLVLRTIAAVLVSGGSIERPEPQVKHLPVVGENMPATMAAVQQIGEEVVAAFTPLDADPSVELAAYEVAAVQREFAASVRILT